MAKITEVHKHLIHRIGQGFKGLSPLQISGEIIKNLGKAIVESSDDVEIEIKKDSVVIRKRKEF